MMRRQVQLHVFLLGKDETVYWVMLLGRKPKPRLWAYLPASEVKIEGCDEELEEGDRVLITFSERVGYETGLIRCPSYTTDHTGIRHLVDVFDQPTNQYRREKGF